MIFSSSATVYSEVAPDKLPYTEDSLTGNCTCAYAKLFFNEYFVCAYINILCKKNSYESVLKKRFLL